MTPNGNFSGAIKHLCEKANKSLGLLTRTLLNKKSKFELGKYLIVLKDMNVRKNITRLRISLHNLVNQTDSHKKPPKILLVIDYAINVQW